jgi:hypothetical protein
MEVNRFANNTLNPLSPAKLEKGRAGTPQENPPCQFEWKRVRGARSGEKSKIRRVR